MTHADRVHDYSCWGVKCFNFHRLCLETESTKIWLMNRNWVAGSTQLINAGKLEEDSIKLWGMSTAIYVEHCGCWTVPCDLSRALRYLNRALQAKSSTARQNNYVQNENADSLTEREKVDSSWLWRGKRKRFSNDSNQPKCNVLRAKEI